MICMRLLASVLLWVTSAFAQARSHSICDSVVNLCFEGSHNVATNTTLGFILPPKTNTVSPSSETFIAVLSFPLPYGFAAFTVGQTNLSTQSNSARAETVDPQVAPIFPAFAFPPHLNRNLSLSNMVAPLATFTTNNSLVPSETAHLAISNKSLVTADRATAILLCKECIDPTISTSDAVTSNFPSVTLLLQDDEPLYLGPKLSDTVLPLSGAESGQFLLNIDAARTSRFDEILHQAGFND